MREQELKQARILVVDDQEANVRLLERILQKAGYSQVTSTTDSRDAIPLSKQIDPDLLILDLMMPFLDGFGVMEELAKQLPQGTYLPILVITADVTKDAMHRALSMGARDYLTKPIDPTEVLLRIANLLETRFLHLRLRDQSRELEELVRERTAQLTQQLNRATEMAEHRRMLLARGAGVASGSSGQPEQE